MRYLLIPALLLAPAFAQEHRHDNSMQHDHSTMESRGNEAMGFDQAKTTHHFLDTKDGGTIRVTAKDASDKASVEQIRAHLQEIAKSFAAGDFDKPSFVHAKNPPGADTLRKLKDQIRYSYRPIAAGAEVVITSKDAEAVKAVREFFGMQIEEHKTGDRTALPQDTIVALMS